jgi:hypothetical protein
MKNNGSTAEKGLEDEYKEIDASWTTHTHTHTQTQSIQQKASIRDPLSMDYSFLQSLSPEELIHFEWAQRIGKHSVSLRGLSEVNFVH